MEAFQYTMYFFPRQVFCVYSPDLSGFFMHLGRQAQPMQGPRLSIDSHCTSE